MKLSQDILFYQIRSHYAIHYSCKTEHLQAERPVFYDKETTLIQACVIIEKKELLELAETASGCDGCVLICPDGPHEPVDIPGCSVISVTEKISPYTLLNTLQSIYNMFDRWDEQLRAVCFRAGNFQDLIDCSENIILTPVSLMDKAFHFVCYCRRSIEKGLAEKYVDENGNLLFETVNELFTGPAYWEQCKKTDAYFFVQEDGHLVFKNLFYHEQYLGRLCIQCKKKSESQGLYYRAILNHLAGYMDRLYHIHSTFTPTENERNSLRNLLVEALENQEGSAEKWEKALLENGWTGQDIFFLVQLRPNPRYDKNSHADYLIREIERIWQGCICFEHNNRLMLLVNKVRFNAGDGLGFKQTLAYFLRESLLVAGVSRKIKTYKDVYPAYKQTEVAIELGVKETPTIWSFYFEDYALRYLLHKSRETFEPEYICSEKLLTLRNHDARKNTEYLKTLRAYFECKFNSSAAAKKVFLHRSSFLNRMERLQKLVKIDFESNDEMLYLSISLKLLEAE